MTEDKPLVVVPFMLSLFIYCFIITCIFYYVSTNDEIIKKYTDKQDFLELLVVSNHDKKIQKIQKNSQKSDFHDKIDIKNPTQKSSTKSFDGIKDLFGKIKTEELNSTKSIIPTKQATVASRLKPNKTQNAKKLISSLKLEATSSISAPSSTGEYDKFRGEVTKILEGFWYETQDTQVGAEANVKIFIDQNGNFSYDIVNFSYNNEFNVKLRNFLEDMLNVKFPYNVNNVPPLTIKFKDDME